jgi:hypothetical protein
MEQRRRTDAVALLLECVAMRKLGVFKVLDRGEMLVDQRGVGERPEMLRRLQFGGVRRQEEQMDMVRHAQLHAGVPAGAVEDEHHLLAGTRADLAGEFRQLHLKEGNTDGGRQMEDGPTRGGMHKSDEIAPGIAVLDGGDRPLPNGAQTRRSKGLRPIRCSSVKSVAHNSMVAWGNAVATCRSSGLTFF